MSDGATDGTTDGAFRADVLRAFKTFMDTATRVDERDALTPFGRRVQDHLGVDVGTLSVLTEEVASHRLVDADIALAELGEGGELLGISAAGNRDTEPLPAQLSNGWGRFEVAAAGGDGADAGREAKAVDFAFIAGRPRGADSGWTFHAPISDTGYDPEHD